MNFDERVKQFQDNIVSTINDSGLPLSVVELVLGQTLQVVSKTLMEAQAKQEESSQDQEG